MKNEMNKIPTPETTFRYEADKYTSAFSAYENMRDHAIDLERRLTVARGFLEDLEATGVEGGVEDDDHHMIRLRETLTQTAPKP